MITVLSLLMWGLLALGGVVVLVAVVMATFDAMPDPPQEPRSFTPSRRSEATPCRRSEAEPCQCRTCNPAGRRAR